MNVTLIDAVLSLVPGAEVLCTGDEVTWIKPDKAPVTYQQIKKEQVRLQEDFNNKEYQRLRAAEYPPMTDYLDGVVKGDQVQIDKYIAACLAVKNKYPKPQTSSGSTENQLTLE